MEEPNQKRTHHRRSLSDTSFRYDADVDELLFDPSSDTDDFFNPHILLPRVSPLTVDSSQHEDFASNGPNPPPNLPRPRPIGHVRSLSVDSDFFEENGTTSFDVETTLAAGARDGVKKGIGMSPDRLAELALLDPKRAKRILANRKSAARSKERRIRYMNELEKKVQTLQNEATTLSAQVTRLQRDTTDLTAENNQLKLRLQAMEQQAQLRDALHEALREELQRFKIAAGQISAANGNSFSRTQRTLGQFGGRKMPQ